MVFGIFYFYLDYKRPFVNQGISEINVFENLIKIK